VQAQPAERGQVGAPFSAGRGSGLCDRSSRPHRSPRRTTAELARIVKPGYGITGNPRDETRGAGWEFLCVAVDDHSRVAFTQMMPDEKALSAAEFLSCAVSWFARIGIRIRRVMTDNGPCFRSELLRDACRWLDLRHRRTRIYTPRTNGKAERFIQSVIREWAYARLYHNSADRLSHLAPWTHQYNWHRPHGGINHSTPIARPRPQHPLDTPQLKGQAAAAMSTSG
jgi:transposase InsO family protein